MVRIQIPRLFALLLIVAAAGVTDGPAGLGAGSPRGGPRRTGAGVADFLGSAQPLPAVPRGTGLPASCREPARRQHPCLGAGAGVAERRPRLGAQCGEPALHRSDGPGQRALHPRQRQGKLSHALRSSDHGPAERADTGRRDLCLVVRRWRGSAAIDLRLRRADQFAGALWPLDIRHRRRHKRTRTAAAGHHRDRGARYFHRRSWRQHRVGRRQSGPRGRIVGRGILLPLLSRNRECPILSPQPRRLQRRTGLRGFGQLASLAAPERALAEFSLPSFALQLPDPHRAGACRGTSAYRGDVSAACLHGRHDRRRTARPATHARVPADPVGHLPGIGQRAGG